MVITNIAGVDSIFIIRGGLVLQRMLLESFVDTTLALLARLGLVFMIRGHTCFGLESVPSTLCSPISCSPNQAFIRTLLSGILVGLALNKPPVD
jgi:hypothetical protein